MGIALAEVINYNYYSYFYNQPFLVEGLIVAYRYVLCKSGNRKMQLTFILTCFAKYVFLADFFVVTNQANYQDYSGIYTEVGIASAEAILKLHGSFI